MEKQNAALKVDGVSCYVLLSTLGRSPTYLFSSVGWRGERERESTSFLVEGEK